MERFLILLCFWAFSHIIIIDRSFMSVVLYLHQNFTNCVFNEYNFLVWYVACSQCNVIEGRSVEMKSKSICNHLWLRQSRFFLQIVLILYIQHFTSLFVYNIQTKIIIQTILLPSPYRFILLYSQENNIVLIINLELDNFLSHFVILNNSVIFINFLHTIFCKKTKGQPSFAIFNGGCWRRRRN